MEYGRILVKENYEKAGDVVLRSYIRNLRAINDTMFLCDGGAYLYITVLENGECHELLTGIPVHTEFYEEIGEEDISMVERKEGIIDQKDGTFSDIYTDKEYPMFDVIVDAVLADGVVSAVIVNKPARQKQIIADAFNGIDDVSSREAIRSDRDIEQEAYANGLSRINPSDSAFWTYNSLGSKIREASELKIATEGYQKRKDDNEEK